MVFRGCYATPKSNFCMNCTMERNHINDVSLQIPAPIHP